MFEWFKNFRRAARPAHIMTDDPGASADEFGLMSERHKFIEDQQALSIPWAMFEIVGFEDDGRIKVEFNWNSAFIKHLDTLGFTAETEEDTVQLFFYTSQMKPTTLSSVFEDEQDDLPVNEDLPTLSENRVMR